MTDCPEVKLIVTLVRALVPSVGQRNSRLFARERPNVRIGLKLARGSLYIVRFVIIWQAQNGDPIRAYRSSKTPDKYMYMYVFSVIHKARGDTQSSAWSRALTTAWSRAYCAITSMASNT